MNPYMPAMFGADDMRQADPNKYIDNCLDKFSHDSPEARIIGYKLMERHNDNVMQKVLLDGTIKKIVLRRANLLKQYVSVQAAWRSRNWFSSTSMRVRVVRSEFIRWKSRIDKFYKMVDCVAGPSALLVYYEDMIQDTVRIMSEIQAYLGLKNRPIKIIGRKYHSDCVSDRIANTADVLDLIEEWSVVENNHRSAT